MQFKRIHRTHWQMVTDNEVVSFNPEKQTFENMKAGFFAIKYKPVNLLEYPKRARDNKLMVVESNLGCN
jgi:hypothetical protein